MVDAQAVPDARRMRASYDGMVTALPGILFMNSGLSERDEAAYDWIRPEDRVHRYHLSLVKRAMGDVDLAGRTVLEIAFGRGGNSYYLSRYTDARRIYGIDSSAGNARSARDIGAARAEFLCADAAALPFPDDVFDVVLSVDWSPSHPHPKALVEEVHRVLRPGGVFVYMDVWTETPESTVSQAKAEVMRNGPLAVCSEEDISEEVFQALGKEDGLPSLIAPLENEANSLTVRKILDYASATRALLAVGVCSARIIRSVKRKG